MYKVSDPTEEALQAREQKDGSFLCRVEAVGEKKKLHLQQLSKTEISVLLLTEIKTCF